jgi:hypothetical protein
MYKVIKASVDFKIFTLFLQLLLPDLIFTTAKIIPLKMDDMFGNLLKVSGQRSYSTGK